jgi:hypothetical protein
MTPTKKATKRTPTKRTSKRTTATKATTDKLRAVATFATVVDDDVMIVHEHEVVNSTHAVVKGREHLFEPADVRVDHE